MDKAKKISFFLCLAMLIACNAKSRYDNSRDNLVFVINEWMSIDFNSKVIKIDFDDLQYRDTLSISAVDQGKIISSFEKNKIEAFEGEKVFVGKEVSMPSQEITVKVYRDGRIKSSLIIHKEFGDSPSTLTKEEKGIAEFRDSVNQIVRADPKFKTAFELCMRQQIKTGNVYQ
jgi:hypothetical protein